MAGAVDRVKELQQAASDYFTSEQNRLNAQYDFLTNIAKARGGAAGLQDVNARGASKIMIDSIDAYLGRPNAPTDEQ